MKLEELFNVSYGNGLSLNILMKSNTGINFVSRTRKNNGVSGKVAKLSGAEPFREGLITVAVGGSVMESFVQIKPFYTGFHVMVLEPKKKMDLNEKLFYCMCIRRNKYKYSYGRQANKTLHNLEVPDKIPSYVEKFDTGIFENVTKSLSNRHIDPFAKRWAWFVYPEVFNIERGFYNKRPDAEGNINFVSASMFNNGVTDNVSKDVIDKMYKGNCLTVVNNGHAGEAFYQKNDFTCSHDINVIRPKGTIMNIYIGLFLIPLFRKERYRFNYGRKWRYERMLKNRIKLPINMDGKPDWKFMENYIKGLKYSRELLN